MMRNVLYARVDIPTCQLPWDKVTNNFLPMVATNRKHSQTICQIEIHLTNERENPYDAPLVKPVIPQAKYDNIFETSNLDVGADIYSNLLVE